MVGDANVLCLHLSSERAAGAGCSRPGLPQRQKVRGKYHTALSFSGLSLPHLEGKSETVALGRALCNRGGAPGAPVSQLFPSKTENSLQTPTQTSKLWISLPFGSA